MENEKQKPSLYIIAGPNGAGKTTFAQKFLPHYAKCSNFINADLIAKGLSPFLPERATFKAGRLLLEQIKNFARTQSDFAFETTLSGKTYVPLLKQLKLEGYKIHLFFLWIPDIKLSLARIAERVKRGGHHVSEKIVRRRFHKGIRHLFKLYRPLLDSWKLFDNSTEEPRLIAIEEHKKLTVVHQSLYDKIAKLANGKL